MYKRIYSKDIRAWSAVIHRLCFIWHMTPEESKSMWKKSNMAKHKISKGKHKISWCDGWGDVGRHPTQRKIVSVKDSDIKICLCPNCLEDYNKYMNSI